MNYKRNTLHRFLYFWGNALQGGFYMDGTKESNAAKKKEDTNTQTFFSEGGREEYEKGYEIGEKALEQCRAVMDALKDK